MTCFTWHDDDKEVIEAYADERGIGVDVLSYTQIRNVYIVTFTTTVGKFNKLIIRFPPDNFILKRRR
jgi:hypothetical protein